MVVDALVDVFGLGVDVKREQSTFGRHFGGRAGNWFYYPGLERVNAADWGSEGNATGAEIAPLGMPEGRR